MTSDASRHQPPSIAHSAHLQELQQMLRAANGAEWEDRKLAWTVACPRCPAVVGEPCFGPGVRDSSKPTAVHVGRLKLVIPVPRPREYWWLTWHDEFLAGMHRDYQFDSGTAPS